MYGYEDYLKECIEKCGEIIINGKEYIYMIDPKRTEINDTFCETIAFCPTETFYEDYPEEVLTVNTYRISWRTKSEGAEFDVDWDKPLCIRPCSCKLRFERRPELNERFIINQKDRGLAFIYSGKTYIMLNQKKKRHKEYFYAESFCEEELVYHDGHPNYPQYELRWNVGQSSTNPEDLGTPDEVVNLYKLMLFSRDMSVIPRDPHVSDRAKNLFWDKLYGIRIKLN